LLLALTVLVGLLFATKRGFFSQPLDVVVDKSEIKLHYEFADVYDPVPISVEEKEKGIQVKLHRPQPFALLAVRVEPIAGLIANLKKESLKDYLPEHTKELYTDYPEYKEELREETKLLDRPATHLVYSYLGSDKVTRLKVDIYSFEYNGKPYFLEFQTKEEDFDQLAPDFKAFRSRLKLLP